MFFLSKGDDIFFWFVNNGKQHKSLRLNSSYSKKNENMKLEFFYSYSVLLINVIILNVPSLCYCFKTKEDNKKVNWNNRDAKKNLCGFNILIKISYNITMKFGHNVSNRWGPRWRCMDPVSREKINSFPASRSCFLVLSRIPNDVCSFWISYPEKFRNQFRIPQTKKILSRITRNPIGDPFKT